MASAKEAVAAVGSEYDLSPPGKTGICYGICDGYLVQLTPGTNQQNAAQVAVSINYRTAALDEPVRQGLASSAALAEAGVTAKHVHVQDGVLTYVQGSGFTGGFKPEQLRATVDALLNTVRGVVPLPPCTCRVCGDGAQAGAILINGAVDCLCPTCLAGVQSAAQQAQAAYDAQPTRMGLAVATAVVAAAVGAAVWAGIVIATERMFWLLAIGIGALIGVATAKAAGKGGWPVQVLAVLATVVSVLVGNVLIYAYAANKEITAQGDTVDWLAFARAIPQLLVEGGGDTLFALGSGLFGAYYAARVTVRKKLDVNIE